MSKRARLLLIATAVASAVLLFTGVFLEDVKAVVLFWRLEQEARHTDRARELAATLSELPGGVRLALRDLNITGGDTRGWSAAILMQTQFDEEVEGALRTMLEANHRSAGKRMAAADVLYERTRERRYIVAMFRLVRDPGGADVHFGRAALRSRVAGISDDVFTVFHTHHTESLPIDEASFMKAFDAIAIAGQKQQGVP